MSDPDKTEAERRSQDGFSNRMLFGGLLLLATCILGASIGRLWIPDRPSLGPRQAAVQFEPVELDPDGLAPFRLAGAWRLSADDPRFGGISALAVDEGRLLALTDSGVVLRLPRPGSGSRAAMIDELPDGPGDGRFKRRRDSEALVRDPQGRGWWVAFEQRHEIWLYDREFRQALQRISFGPARWPPNRGIEALASDDDGLVIIPEGGDTVLRQRGGRLESSRLSGKGGGVSEASVLPSGEVLLIERRITLTGFSNALVMLERDATGYRRGRRLPLDLGPLDNVEAAAAERLPGGGVRLWLATDDNQQLPLRTLLIALDLPAKASFH